MDYVTRILVVAPDKTITPLLQAVNSVARASNCCWHFELHANAATKTLQARAGNGSGPYDLIIVDDGLAYVKSFVLVATRKRWTERFLIQTSKPPQDNSPYFFFPRPVEHKALVGKINELITIIG